MSDQNQMNQLIQLISAQNALLVSIAEELQKLNQMQRQSVAGDGGPNYRRSLNEYATFNWYSIDATPTREVGDGINEVSWGGYTWWRRSGTGKFGNAIWFSRSIGSNDDGTPKYARLITFKDSDPPEPLRVQVEPGPRDHNVPPAGLSHRPPPPINPHALDDCRDYKDANRRPTAAKRPERHEDTPPPPSPAELEKMDLDPISRDQAEYEYEVYKREQQMQPPPPPSSPPMSQAQAVASAHQNGTDGAPAIDPQKAEEAFYEMVKPAIRNGLVSVRIINEYTAAAKEVGWTQVLQQLQQDIAAATAAKANESYLSQEPQ